MNMTVKKDEQLRQIVLSVRSLNRSSASYWPDNSRLIWRPFARFSKTRLVSFSSPKFSKYIILKALFLLAPWVRIIYIVIQFIQYRVQTNTLYKRFTLFGTYIFLGYSESRVIPYDLLLILFYSKQLKW